LSKLTAKIEEDGNVILDGEATIRDLLSMAGALLEVSAREAGVPANEMLKNFMEVTNDIQDDILPEETNKDLQ
jgi:cell division ATPase FtsA